MSVRSVRKIGDCCLVAGERREGLLSSVGNFGLQGPFSLLKIVETGRAL